MLLPWLGKSPPAARDLDQIAEALAPREGESRSEKTARLEQFVRDHPQSGWTPSIRERLAEDYSRRLRYQRAMEHWADNLLALREETDPPRKAAADRALAYLTRHLLIAGQMEELGALLKEYQGRVLDEGPLSTRRIRTAQKYRQVLKYPQMSYKCGIFALDRLGVHLGWEYPRQPLRDEPSGPEGLSLLDLQRVAGKYGLLVIPARAGQPGLLPVPAVMHTRLGHYVTLLRVREDQVLVFDPGAKQELWVPVEDVAEEATGYFLAPGPSLPRGLIPLDTAAAAQVRGRTTSCPPDHSQVEDCDGDDNVEWNDGAEDWSCSQCEEEESCCGAARVVVRPDKLDLFIKDRPLVYRPSKGPMIYPKIRFKRYWEMLSESEGGNGYPPTTIGQKVYSQLGQLRWLKRQNHQLIVGVCGCVAQQEGERIQQRVPGVYGGGCGTPRGWTPRLRI